MSDDYARYWRPAPFLPEADNLVGNKFAKLIVRINYSTEIAGVVGV